jgi:hypothetical protein
MFRILVVLDPALYNLKNVFRGAVREREKVEMNTLGFSSSLNLNLM